MSMSANHMPLAWNAYRKQAGQAMTEFSIAATFVLIPLFLMIPLLGKFLDMKASTIQAARYAAWERTVWTNSSGWTEHANAQSLTKDDSALQTELTKRFFSDNCQDFSEPSCGGGGNKQFWKDHTRTNMSGSPAHNEASSEGAGTDVYNGNAGIFSLYINKPIKQLVGSDFKLDTNSLYTSSVTFQSTKTGPMDRVNAVLIAPQFAENSVLLANGWSANGPNFVDKQTKGLALPSLLAIEPVKSVVQVMQAVLSFLGYSELGPNSLRITGNNLQPDQVPPDRLNARPAATPPLLTAKQKSDLLLKDIIINATGGAIDITQDIGAQQNIARLEGEIIKAQGAMNSCKNLRQTEFATNCTAKQGVKVGNFCIGYTNLIPYLIPPPSGSSSYTPTADADPICAGIPQRIAALEILLADKDIQADLKKSDLQLINSQLAIRKFDSCAVPPPSDQNLISECAKLRMAPAPVDIQKNPVWVAERARITKIIDDLQSKIDALKVQLNAF